MRRKEGEKENDQEKGEEEGNEIQLHLSTKNLQEKKWCEYLHRKNPEDSTSSHIPSNFKMVQLEGESSEISEQLHNVDVDYQTDSIKSLEDLCHGIETEVQPSEKCVLQISEEKSIEQAELKRKNGLNIFKPGENSVELNITTNSLKSTDI